MVINEWKGRRYGEECPKPLGKWQTECPMGKKVSHEKKKPKPSRGYRVKPFLNVKSRTDYLSSPYVFLSSYYPTSTWSKLPVSLDWGWWKFWWLTGIENLGGKQNNAKTCNYPVCQRCFHRVNFGRLWGTFDFFLLLIYISQLESSYYCAFYLDCFMPPPWKAALAQESASKLRT